jgi:prevent-host-death family protein
MHQVTPEETKANLSDLIEAAQRGEKVVIVQVDGSAAQLVPITQFRRTCKAGSAKGQITISPDFDEPLPELGEYMR